MYPEKMGANPKLPIFEFISNLNHEGFAGNFYTHNGCSAGDLDHCPDTEYNDRGVYESSLLGLINGCQCRQQEFAAQFEKGSGRPMQRQYVTWHEKKGQRYCWKLP